MKKRMITLWALLLLAALPTTAWAEDETIQVEEEWNLDLIQCGSLNGEQAIPSGPEIMLLADTGQETAWKEQIYQGLYDAEASITLTDTSSTVTQENLNQFVQTVEVLYKAVVDDCPELFYVTGNASLSGSGSSATGLQVTITPRYLPDYSGKIPVFQEKLKDVIAYVESFSDPMEQALAAHDYLITCCAYNWDTAANNNAPSPTESYVYSAYGALVDGDAVCQGYALAYKLILNKVGIPCVTVSSIAMKHMWNLVQLDHNWYHVDVTGDDPTPNVEGGGRHANFLRSDTGIATEGHHDWDTDIICSDEYEDDWWLNDVWSPIHYWQGNYYYIKTGSGSYLYQVYRTDRLDDEGEAVTANHLANSYSSQYGVVWLEGQLYYTKAGAAGTRVLMRCDLTSGSLSQVGTFSFSQKANGIYEARRDGVGLRYNADTEEIETFSNTWPTLSMPSFAVQDYPPEWNQADRDTTALLGSYAAGGGLRIGVMWAEEAQEEPPMLLAAFYDQYGRQAALRTADTDELDAGLNILQIAVPTSYRTIQLFLLAGDDLVPLCASMQS